MAQLIVRDIEESVKAKLKRRAERHGRSTEEEVREILRDAVKTMPSDTKLGSKITSYFKGVGLTAPLEELPREPARAAQFGSASRGSRRKGKT